MQPTHSAWSLPGVFIGVFALAIVAQETGDDVQAGKVSGQFRVEVFDSRSHAPAENLQVVRARSIRETVLPRGRWDNVTAPLFGEAYEALSSGNSSLKSPLLLSAGESELEYWVRSPNSAWSRIDVQALEEPLADSSTERSGEPIALHPHFGDLEVEVIAPIHGEYQLRLAYANQTLIGSGGGAYGGRSSVVALDDRRLYTFTGLIPTSYKVFLVNPERTFRSFDSTVVVLEPGARERIVLQTTEVGDEPYPEREEPVLVEGRLKYDSEWNEFLTPWVSLEFSAIDPNDPSSRKWMHGFQKKPDAPWSVKLSPGTYVIDLVGYGEVGRLDVRPPEHEPVEIDLGPAPMFSRVDVGFEGGMKPKWICWHPVHAPPSHYSDRVEIQANGIATFVTLPGEIKIVPYDDANKSIGDLSWIRTVVSGANSLVFQVPARTSAEVVLTLGTVPISAQDWTKVTAQNFPPEVLLGSRASSLRNGVARFNDLEPGWHQLHIPPLDGYWSPQVREVEIKANEFARVQVELQPILPLGK